MNVLITFEEFKKAKEKSIEKRFKLFQWVKEKEQEYKIEKIVPRDFNSIPLYYTATHSFINECYLSSTLVVGSAIEQFLLWQDTKESKLKEKVFRKDFYKKIEGLISEQLLNELKSFLMICRDEIAHPKTRNHLSALGLPYNMKEGYFGGPDVKPIQIHIDSQSYQTKIGYECAKTGLELFLKIANQIAKKMSNFDL